MSSDSPASPSPAHDGLDPCTAPPQPAPPHVLVNNLIPMVHVADVDRSLTFYAHLGFRVIKRLTDQTGRAFWGSASSGKAEIMFARASEPVDPRTQAVLFYMYSEDIQSLRGHLLRSGLRDGGLFTGDDADASPPKPHDNRVVYDITHPFYMEAGEMRVSDPDGYCVLVGQLE